MGWCLSQMLCDGWCPWATFDDWQARHPRRLVGSPEGASALVVGNFSTLMPSWRPGCRSQVLPTPQLCSIPKCSGRGEKGVSLFCRFSQSWRADAHSQALTFLWGETAGQECFSWSPAVCCEGRGDEGNGKLFPSPSAVCLRSDGVLELLCWISGLLKTTLEYDCENWCFLVE